MTATYETRAWSCAVRLVVEDDRALPAAARDLDALLARVDVTASRFRPDSALSRANAHAGRPVAVPALLVELVGHALDAAAVTDGAVDPALGLAMQRIGYDRDITALRPGMPGGVGPVGAGRPHATTTSPWRRVRLHREAGLLTVPAGTALDLGATAKAWTADHAATTLAARYGTGILVELGGDVAVAGPRAGGWVLHVAERAGGPGQKVTLHAGGLTTSTTTVRAWTQDGTARHHVLDPLTGEPVHGPWRTVSVAGTSALEANTASTAALVKGAAAVAWLEGRGLAARLVGQDGAVRVVGRWPRIEELAA